MTAIEGNKLIAEFMGLKFHKIGWVDDQHIDGNYECVELKYHSSWDWQIPVYSKLAKAIREIVTKNPEHKPTYERLLNHYESAVFNNQPDAGFLTISSNLQWHNQQK